MKRSLIVLIGIAPDLTLQFIQRANKNNCNVIVIEEEKEIIKNKKLIENAYEVFSANIGSYELLKCEIEKIQKKESISAIITFREYYTEVTAKLIEYYGLYGVPSKIVAKCNNKLLSRKEMLGCTELINKTRYKLCRNITDVENFLNKIRKPIVIKPLREKGSFGAYKISNVRDLNKYYKLCCFYEKDNEGILAEEFIEGKELAFQVFVKDGIARLYGISEKKMYKNCFIASGYTTLCKFDKILFDQYSKIVQEIIELMKIDFGPVLIEGFETEDNKFYFGEIHTRYGGEHIFDITEKSGNYDTLTPIINTLVDKCIDFSEKIKDKNILKSAASRAIYTQNGIVKKIHGIQDVRKISGIELVEIFCKKGDIINKLRTSLDRIGWVVASADSENELEQIFDEAFLKLYIEMESKNG